MSPAANHRPSDARTYFDERNRLRQEYDRQVRFNYSMRHACWRIMTYVPVDIVADCSQWFVDSGLLKRFDMNTQPLPSCNELAVIFSPKEIAPLLNLHARRMLLKYLHQNDMKIIWKEDRHGYEIDSSGHIERKWPLMPAKVKPFAALPKIPAALSLPLLTHGGGAPLEGLIP